MQWLEFVFSEKWRERILRHTIFWVVWWFYYSLCYYLYQQPLPKSSKALYVTLGSHLFLKSFLLILICAVATYASIYFLLPQIIKGKWWIAAANTGLFCVLLFCSGYFMFWNVFPFVDSIFGPYRANSFVTKFWPAVSLGLLDPLKVLASAAIIKYAKYWWRKHWESEIIKREKINAELQLLKAQIHPDFLFKTLDSIYAHAVLASPRAPGILLKLSDLLSYMLYECDQSFVPLEKEIVAMKEYIELEKLKQNDNLEMEVTIKGNPSNKKIAPLLLLPFVENSFKQCNHVTEQSWINLDIVIEEDRFSMKLINGMAGKVQEQTIHTSNGLAEVQKRLTLLYPGKHELKTILEQEMFIVLLSIRLDDTLPVSLIPKTTLTYAAD